MLSPASIRMESDIVSCDTVERHGDGMRDELAEDQVTVWQVDGRAPLCLRTLADECA